MYDIYNDANELIAKDLQKELTKHDKALLEAKNAGQKEIDKLTKSYELKLADKEKACQTAKEAYEKALAD